MFKKILSISALSVSALLLIGAAADVLSDKVALFQLLPVRLAVVLMILLSLAITVMACMDGSWRRPLLLLACLLQTPVGGAMGVLLVYGLCFPESLPLDTLLPYLTALVALASVIQAVVMIVGEGMYDDGEENEDEDEDEDEDDDWDEDFDDSEGWGDPADTDAANESPAEETSPVKPATKEASKAEPKATPKVMPKATPRKAVLTFDEEDDDLAPIPKKKRGGQALAPSAVSARRADTASPKSEQKQYTDAFDLLKEEAELNERKNSVKDIFAENNNGE